MNTEILSFLFQRADAMQAFWNFYIAVSTAVLAFLAAAKKGWLNKIICIALTFGFAIFAIANLWAIVQVCAQREALITFIYQLEGFDQRLVPVIESTRPPYIALLVPFHAFLDIAIITLIWKVALYRRKRG
jgi:hypothetical protein